MTIISSQNVPESGDENTAADKPAASESTAGEKRESKRPPRKPAMKKKKKRRRIGGGFSWTTVALFSVVAIAALSIMGYAGWKVWDTTRPFGEQSAQKIDGVHNYRAEDPSWLTNRHLNESLNYAVSPSVGGDHNSQWQNCEGAIYGEEIPEEHATHSLEHGAVWITYNPDKASEKDIATLEEKVRGTNYLFMSPYPNLDATISLQSWGFRLKLDSASDSRVDEFIKAFRLHSSVESGATCGGGVTTLGDKPEKAAPNEGMQQS